MRPSEAPKSPSTPPLFKADKTIRIEFSASEGKIRVNYPGWDDPKVVQPDRAFQVSLGAQGLEGRIVERADMVPKGERYEDYGGWGGISDYAGENPFCLLPRKGGCGGGAPPP